MESDGLGSMLAELTVELGTVLRMGVAVDHQANV
jgi:hypothetical protein